MMQTRSQPQAENSAEVARIIQIEENKGMTFVFWGRTTVLFLLACWVAITVPVDRSVQYLFLIAVFAILGLASYHFSRTGYGGTRIAALFLAIDAAAISYFVSVPIPYEIVGWTQQMNLRLPGFLYLGVFVVAMSLSYRPWLVVWCGGASVLSWVFFYYWVATQPGSKVHNSSEIIDLGAESLAALGLFLDPSAVSITRLSNQVMFLLLLTLLATVAVWRSRRLVRNRMIAETQKAALARYFSPNMVNVLASQPTGFGKTREQHAAVLFADMCEFTRISEQLEPADLIALLRDFHSRLAQIVFRYEGTVDKYIGDAIMASFGTPETGKDDAVRALECALAMLGEIQSWSRERAVAGMAPISIRIGVHFGKVIIGNIGDDRRLEFAVLGDTVNVASRLERHTRVIASPLVVSDEMMAAVAACGVDAKTLAPRLRRAGQCNFRGRTKPTKIWSYEAEHL